MDTLLALLRTPFSAIPTVTPPTRVLAVQPAVGFGSATTPQLSPTFNVTNGDLLVLQAFSEDAARTLNAPTWDGTGTWTLQQSIVVTSYCTAYLYTCPVTATATGRTITMARSDGLGGMWSFVASLWRNHGGLGVSGKANVTNGFPALTLSIRSGSALICGNSDWAAIDGTTRTWNTINGAPMTEVIYFRNSLTYAVYTGYVIDDHTSPGSPEVFGLTAPAGQTYSILAAEVLGIESSGNNYTGTPGDPLGITDSVADVLDAVDTVSDPLGITDSAVDVQSNIRSQNDSLGITDSVSASFQLASSPSDPVGLSDTTGAAQDLVRTSSDPVGLTDAVADVLASLRTLADAVGLTDAATPIEDTVRGVSDPVGITDSASGILSVGGTDYTQAPSDPMGLTDVVVDALDGVRGPSDTTGVTDVVAAVVGFARTPSDPVGITDATSFVQTTIDAVTDALGLTDSVNAQLVGSNTQSLADGLGITDAVTDVLNAFDTVSDAEGITDVVSVAATDTRSISDAVGLTDSVVAQLDRVVTVADLLGLIDGVSTDAATVIPKVITDPEAITDSVGIAVGFDRSLSDPVGLSDAITVVMSRVATVADFLNLADAIGITGAPIDIEVEGHVAHRRWEATIDDQVYAGKVSHRRWTGVAEEHWTGLINSRRWKGTT